MEHLPLFPEQTTTPLQRIFLSARGNLQLLFRAYYNEPIDLIIHSHEVTLVPRDNLTDHLLIQQTYESIRPALNPDDNEFFMIERKITLKGNHSKRRFCSDDSVTLIPKSVIGECSLAETLQMNTEENALVKDNFVKKMLVEFIQGKHGIGQCFHQLNYFPSFHMIEYKAQAPDVTKASDKLLTLDNKPLTSDNPLTSEEEMLNFGKEVYPLQRRLMLRHQGILVSVMDEFYYPSAF